LKTRTAYEALGGTFATHESFDALEPGAYLTGPVPRVHPERNFGRHGKVGPLLSPGGVVDDTIPEDQSLVLVTDRGLVVVAGCGHAGIVNTLEYALHRTSTTRVYAAIVLLGVLGTALFYLVSLIERFAVPWHVSLRGAAAGH